MLWTFLPIAVLVTVTPGAATANVIRSAMRGGRRAGVLTIAGNSVGVLAWGLLSVLGISALVTRARRAFAGSGLGRRLERITGAALIALGARVALEHQ